MAKWLINGLLSIFLWPWSNVQAVEIQKVNLLRWKVSLGQEGQQQEIKKVNWPRLSYQAIMLEARPGELKLKINELKMMGQKSRPAINPPRPCRCPQDWRGLEALDWEQYNKGVERPYELVYLGEFRGRPVTKLILFSELYSKEKGSRKVTKLDLIVSSNRRLKLFQKPTLGKRLLIASPQKYFETLRPYINFKREQSFEVRLFNQSEWGLSAKKIKKELHNIYKKWPYDYAILIGHEFDFPTFYLETTTDYKTPTDLFYFTFSGEDDYIPEVVSGRFVVKNPTQLQMQLKKSMQVVPLGNLLGVASDEGDGPTDEEYLSLMLTPLKKSTDQRVLTLVQRSRYALPEKVIDEVNRGVSWMTYIGHGFGDSWASFYANNMLDTDHLKGLKNKQFPIVLDIACQNGRFSTDDRLGEHFLNQRSGQTPHGALAYMGAGVNISWHGPAVMGVGVTQSAVGSKTLGEAFLKGKFHLMKYYDHVGEIRETFIWYHLLGDPTLMISLR